MHKRSQRGQRDSGQMSQAAASHIEDDNIALGEPIFGQFDVIKHAEHAHSIREVQFTVVRIREAVK